MKSLEEIHITITTAHIESVGIFKIKYIIYRKHFPGLYRTVFKMFVLMILLFNL